MPYVPLSLGNTTVSDPERPYNSLYGDGTFDRSIGSYGIGEGPEDEYGIRSDITVDQSIANRAAYAQSLEDYDNENALDYRELTATPEELSVNPGAQSKYEQKRAAMDAKIANGFAGKAIIPINRDDFYDGDTYKRWRLDALESGTSVDAWETYKGAEDDEFALQQWFDDDVPINDKLAAARSLDINFEDVTPTTMRDLGEEAEARFGEAIFEGQDPDNAYLDLNVNGKGKYGRKIANMFNPVTGVNIAEHMNNPTSNRAFKSNFNRKGAARYTTDREIAAEEESRNRIVDAEGIVGASVNAVTSLIGAVPNTALDIAATGPKLMSSLGDLPTIAEENIYEAEQKRIKGITQANEDLQAAIEIAPINAKVRSKRSALIDDAVNRINAQGDPSPEADAMYESAKKVLTKFDGSMGKPSKRVPSKLKSPAQHSRMDELDIYYAAKDTVEWIEDVQSYIRSYSDNREVKDVISDRKSDWNKAAALIQKAKDLRKDGLHNTPAIALAEMEAVGTVMKGFWDTAWHNTPEALSVMAQSLPQIALASASKTAAVMNLGAKHLNDSVDEFKKLHNKPPTQAEQIMLFGASHTAALVALSADKTVANMLGGKVGALTGVGVEAISEFVEAGIVHYAPRSGAFNEDTDAKYTNFGTAYAESTLAAVGTASLAASNLSIESADGKGRISPISVAMGVSVGAVELASRVGIAGLQKVAGDSKLVRFLTHPMAYKGRPRNLSENGQVMADAAEKFETLFAQNPMEFEGGPEAFIKEATNQLNIARAQSLAITMVPEGKTDKEVEYAESIERHVGNYLKVVDMMNASSSQSIQDIATTEGFIEKKDTVFRSMRSSAVVTEKQLDIFEQAEGLTPEDKVTIKAYRNTLQHLKTMREVSKDVIYGTIGYRGFMQYKQSIADNIVRNQEYANSEIIKFNSLMANQRIKYGLITDYTAAGTTEQMQLAIEEEWQKKFPSAQPLYMSTGIDIFRATVQNELYIAEGIAKELEANFDIARDVHTSSLGTFVAPTSDETPQQAVVTDLIPTEFVGPVKPTGTTTVIEPIKKAEPSGVKPTQQTIDVTPTSSENDTGLSVQDVQDMEITREQNATAIRIYESLTGEKMPKRIVKTPEVINYLPIEPDKTKDNGVTADNNKKSIALIEEGSKILRNVFRKIGADRVKLQQLIDARNLPWEISDKIKDRMLLLKPDENILVPETVAHSRNPRISKKNQQKYDKQLKKYVDHHNAVAWYNLVIGRLELTKEDVGDIEIAKIQSTSGTRVLAQETKIGAEGITLNDLYEVGKVKLTTMASKYISAVATVGKHPMLYHMNVEYMPELKEWATNFTNVLNEKVLNVKNIDGKAYQSDKDYQSMEDPVLGFTQEALNDDGTPMTDENGNVYPIKLNKEVTSAMSITAIHMINTAFNKRLTQSERLINSLLGRTSGSKVANHEWKIFDGKDNLLNEMKKQAGEHVFSQLDIVLKDTMDEKIHDDMIMNLGTYVLAGLDSIGAIQTTGILQSTYNKMKAGQEISQEEIDAAVNGDHSYSKGAIVKFVGMMSERVDGKRRYTDSSGDTIETANDLNTTINDLLGTKPRQTMQDTKPTMDQIRSWVRKSSSKVSDFTRKALFKYSQNAWMPTKALHDAYNILTTDQVIELQGGIVDLDDVLERNMLSAEGKRDGILREIQEYDDVYDYGVPVYGIPINYRNNRSGFDNEGSLQNNLILRALTPMQKWTTTVKSETQRNLFKRAALQGLEDLATGDIVAMTNAQVSTEFGRLMKNRSIAASLKHLRSLKKGSTLTKAQKTQVFNTAMSTGNGMKGLVTLTEMASYNPDGEFITQITYEIDGVTNGVAIGLLQLGGIRVTEAMLNKIGVGKDGFNFTRHRADVSTFDLYETIADSALTILANIKATKGPADIGSYTKLIDSIQFFTGELETKTGQITKVFRNITKYPLMTSFYFRAMEKISNEVGIDLLEDVYGKIQNAKTDSELQVIAEHIENISGVKIGMTMANKRNIDFAKSENPDIKKLEAKIILQGRNTIGKAITSAIKANFSDVFESRLHLSEMMGVTVSIYTTAFEAKIAKVRESSGGIISRADRAKIFTDLVGILPSIPHYTSKQIIEELQVIYESSEISERNNGKAKVRLSRKLLGGKTITSPAVERGFSDPGVRAIPISVHGIDAAVQYILMLKIDSLSLHDANQIGIDEVSELHQAQNAAFKEVMTNYDLAGEFHRVLERSYAGIDDDIKAAMDTTFNNPLRRNQGNKHYLGESFFHKISDVENTLEDEVFAILKSVTPAKDMRGKYTGIDHYMREARAKSNTIIMHKMARIAGIDSWNQYAFFDGDTSTDTSQGLDKEAGLTATESLTERQQAGHYLDKYGYDGEIQQAKGTSIQNSILNYVSNMASKNNLDVDALTTFMKLHERIITSKSETTYSPENVAEFAPVEEGKRDTLSNALKTAQEFIDNENTITLPTDVGTDGKIQRSSASSEINVSDFDAVTPMMLNAQGVRDLFDELAKGSNNTQDHINHLRKSIDLIEENMGEELRVYVTDHIAGVSQGLYNSDTGSIYVSKGTASSLYRTGQSPAEVYAHEGVHSIITYAIENIPFLRNIAEKLFDSAYTYAKENGGWEIFNDGDKSEAQALFKHMFNNTDTTTNFPTRLYGLSTDYNKNNGLNEFLTLVATNEKVRAALKPVDISSKRGSASLLEQFADFFVRLLSSVGRKIAGISSHNVSDGVMELVAKMAENNRKESFSLMDNLIMETPIETMLNNAVVRVATNGFKVTGKIAKATNTAIGTHIKDIVQTTPTLNGFGLRKAFNGIWRDMGNDEDNLIASIANEMDVTNPNKNPHAGIVARAKQLVQGSRQKTVFYAAKNINDSFLGGELTEDEHKLLVKYWVGTGIPEAMDAGLDIAKVRTLLNDEQVRLNTVANMQTELLNAPHGEYMALQAESLGKLLYERQALRQLTHTNVIDIVNATGLRIDTGEDPEQYADTVDMLSTIHAIGRMSASDKAGLTAILDREVEANPTDNGMTFISTLHTASLKDGRDIAPIFEDKLYHKGYVPISGDRHSDVKLSSDKADSRLLAMGYVRISPNKMKRDLVDPLAQDAIYEYYNPMGGASEFSEGAYSTHRSKVEGTTISAILAGMGYVGEELSPTRENAFIRDFANTVITSNTFKNGDENAAFLTPVTRDGVVIGHRYLKSHAFNEKYMGASYNIGAALATQEADIPFKSDASKMDRMVDEVLVNDFKENGIRDAAGFILIDPEGTAKYDVAFRKLPSTSREALYTAFGGDGIYVRASTFKMIFGRRRWRLNDLAAPIGSDIWDDSTKSLSKDMAKALSQPLVRRGEEIANEISSEVRDFFVMKTGATLVGNVASNNWLLWLKGMGPIEMAKLQAEGLQFMLKYMKNEQELDTLVRKYRVGQAIDLNRMRQLQDVMARNPMSRLISQGQAQTIQDDVDTSASVIHSEKSIIASKVQPIVQRIPEAVRNVANFVYMGKRSSSYKFMRNATQLSDLVSRYALDTHYRTKTTKSDMEIEAIVRRTFVNYDTPTHELIELGNDLGVFRFTKYFLRTQMVIAETVKGAPARALGLQMLEEHITDTSNVMDSVLTPSSLMNRAVIPGEDVLGVLDIHMVNNAKDLID